jgi:hypothetical protein
VLNAWGNPHDGRHTTGRGLLRRVAGLRRALEVQHARDIGVRGLATPPQLLGKFLEGSHGYCKVMLRPTFMPTECENELTWFDSCLEEKLIIVQTPTE